MVCVCVCVRWLSLARKRQWTLVCLLPASPMDPAWDTLYSATSKSPHTYVQRSAPYTCVCKVCRRCSLFRCGPEDDSKAEGGIATLQEVLQQRNFLKYINNGH